MSAILNDFVQQANLKCMKIIMQYDGLLSALISFQSSLCKLMLRCNLVMLRCNLSNHYSFFTSEVFFLTLEGEQFKIKTNVNQKSIYLLNCK